MMDEVWLIPICLLIIAGIGAVYIEYRRKSCAHDRAEILSGFGIVLLSTGFLEIAIRIGDVLGAVLVLSGMFVSIVYGIEHIRARRVERRKLGELKKEEVDKNEDRLG